MIVASIPNVRYFRNILELNITKNWEYKDKDILDSTHLRFFTRKSMKRMFEKAGYRLIRQEGINKAKSMRFRMFDLLTFGFFHDAKFLQFVCVAMSSDKFIS